MLIEMPFSYPGKIFRSPMPFSQFDRTGVWRAYQDHAVDLVVILVEPQEYLVYAGRDLPAYYQSEGLSTLQIPVPDFGIPADRDLWDQGLIQVAQAAGAGENIAIHCLAGIGRTGTFLACLAKKELGITGERAIQWVRETLPGAMENSHQESFVIDY